jgi:hypothetical protein
MDDPSCWNLEKENLWMTCAYRVQNLRFPRPKAAARLAVKRARACDMEGAYPLGVAEDAALDCGDCRPVPEIASQRASRGVGMKDFCYRSTDASL